MILNETASQLRRLGKTCKRFHRIARAPSHAGKTSGFRRIALRDISAVG